MSELSINDLTFRYKRHNVFEDVNLSAKGGEIISLVGPNGAGKTTLLKCINRLHLPASGNVLVNDTDVKKITRIDLARMIAYVPQSENVRFSISVFDTVLLGRKPYMKLGNTKADVEKVVNVLLDMKIDNLAGKTLDQLSGGERQKVMIAKAIAQDPEIMLLDEPTTFLDMGFQLKIMQEIRDLVDSQDICAIITTHDLNYALQYSDKIAVLKNGSIIYYGPPEKVTGDLIGMVYGVEAYITQEAGRPYIVPIRALY